MKDKLIISLITLLDPKDKLTANPIHKILFVLIAFPVLAIAYSTHPAMIIFVSIIVFLQLLLFMLKFMVKDKYKEDIDEVKDSIPDFNLFHLFMFLLIFSPILFIIYTLVIA